MPITSERPMLLFNEGADIRKNWESLPADIRPLSTMVIAPDPDLYDYPDITTKHIKDSLAIANKQKIPVAVRVAAGPHTLFSMDIETIKNMIATPGGTVRGMEILNPDFDPAAPADFQGMTASAYTAALAKLAADSGLWLIIQTCHKSVLDLVGSAANAELRETLHAYGNNIIFIHAYRGAESHNLIRSAALGLWLTGYAAHYGISPQSRIAFEAGYWGLNHYRGPGGGNLSLMHSSYYSKMIIVGIATGATVLEFDCPWDIFPDQRGFDSWKNYIYPLLRKTLKEKLIPTREEFLSENFVAYRPEPFDTPAARERVQRDIDTNYSTGFLFRAAYGLWNPSYESELIPDISRFRFIPVVPPEFKNNPKTFIRVIDTGEEKTEQGYSELLSVYYRRDPHLKAWRFHAGHNTFLVQNKENTEEMQLCNIYGPRQPENVSLETAPGKPISLKWQPVENATGYNIYARRYTEAFFTRITDKPVTDTKWTAPAFPFDGDSLPEIAVTAVSPATEPIYFNPGFYDSIIVPDGESPILNSLLIGDDGKTIFNNHIDLSGSNPAKHLEEISHPMTCLASEPNILERFKQLETAFINADTAAVADFYSERYFDDDANDKAHIIEAYNTFFTRFAPKEPDFRYEPQYLGRAAIDLLNILNSEDEKQTFATAWVYFARIDPLRDRLIRVPIPINCSIEFTWEYETQTSPPAWRITKTDPPIPRIQDILSYDN